MKIYFVTMNRFKINEMSDYLKRFNVREQLSIDIWPVEQNLQEILHSDIDEIVKHKTLDAYQYLGLPCVVEHGGLFMDALPGLPGGVGQIVWDAVGDRMCGFLRAEDSRGAVARSVIGYCDGRRVRIYRGETRGQVAESSRGDYLFHWDPIFMPEGSDQTYGEMGLEKKRATSPAVKAWEAFLKAEFGTDGHTPRGFGAVEHW
jgi:XTP/dITP diphosphohydrolase